MERYEQDKTVIFYIFLKDMEKCGARITPIFFQIC